MSYPVIIGKNRRQLQAILKLPPLQKDARWVLGAYSRGDQWLEVDAAILLRQPGGKWALLCCSFPSSPSVDELRLKAAPLSRGVKVVPHLEFIRDRKWRELAEKGGEF